MPKNRAPIKKILIANRGEIACRIIATCKEMGIRTVAVSSEADRHFPHAQLADEVFFLGAGTLRETYINHELILKAVKVTGADAIHPGYGLLSENPVFRKKVEDAQIIFIGPTSENIELMGDKAHSKSAMEKIGVPVIPGHHGGDQSPEFLKEKAKKIGFPVLIKASAGGGGKGMRIVEKGEEFISALESAKREALSAFGNDEVLIEKYLTRPRHIEMQMLSDSHGNHLHLYDRECSIQRRHQKIIEEAPSPALGEGLRKKMSEVAVKITSSMGYLGAGTIEMILEDGTENFYFLEMNTRLQVEHPVTELITGLDLVRCQIMVAEGRELPFKQCDIIPRGHAVEARIYSEDPDNQFLPTLGSLDRIHFPHIPGVRIDSGLVEGVTLTLDFDPMLAKCVAYAQNREAAVAKLAHCLEESVLQGLVTNKDYLLRILRHQAFIQGKLTTGFVQDYAADLKKADQLEPLDRAWVMAGFLMSQGFVKKSATTQTGPTGPWELLGPFRN